MLPQLAMHLTDADLIRLRDGEPVEARAREHITHCPLCQELLAAWRSFGEALRASREPSDSLPEEDLPLRPMAAACMMPEAFYYERSLSQKETAPPEVPESWIEDLLPRLAPRRPVRDLGSVTVVRASDGRVRLRREEVEVAYRSPREVEEVDDHPQEITLELDRERELHLSLRRAAHRVFLITRLTRHQGTPVRRGELTLVTETGRLRVQGLDHGLYELEGIAWFDLPATESARLFVHLDTLAQLEIEQIATEV